MAPTPEELAAAHRTLESDPTLGGFTPNPNCPLCATGAERYLADRMNDPEYANAYGAARKGSR